MRSQWEFPVKDTLENDKVKLSTININQDIDELFEAASLENNGEDLFRYVMNIPPMDSIDTFEKYLRQKLAKENEVVYKIFSKRLKKIVVQLAL